MGGTLILAAAAGTVAVLLAVRLWVVLRPRAAVPRRSLSLLVVAGSGGHTTEILRLLENLSDAYSPRHYVIADTDEMSAHKINSFEVNRADRNPSAMDLSITWHSLNNKFSRILYSPHSQKPGGPAVLAVHGTHHLVLSVALLPPDSPSEARFGTVPHAAFVPCSTLGHTYHSSGQNVAIKASTQTTEVNCIFRSWPATCSEYDLAASSRRSGVWLLSLRI
ncbi:UDP-N-acetylglucosamine transferase subunit ALG14 homolog isoform X5 [Balaenoptera acutorostrata]|uniref:UDP-N-acetylglucosamine transferase subunit ALG14 n=1 Tax=Balaenoptera acutorostrata TaxID=9767 RepID=A0A452C7X3_BALAC|nr:UDP-N-acetylglucosamine transferase subunit ALG14 homolog isoform X5 [Balaenoptera acutorostrata]